MLIHGFLTTATLQSLWASDAKTPRLQAVRYMEHSVPNQTARSPAALGPGMCSETNSGRFVTESLKHINIKVEAWQGFMIT